ncbi:hypothetical protein JOC36_001474 [Weissella uvarum]|uniref:hypothetical protein n=1 Tax=Weissella uvarum TaxID=1479233 RepID=UPI00195F3C79|nr:hypothetical protein [Weissella uvarum]MBM7617881.1 hypothetical protein [Weissella uvarum]MCM0596121.1 hypothetical protein [Weissella uvarum]
MAKKNNKKKRNGSFFNRILNFFRDKKNFKKVSVLIFLVFGFFWYEQAFLLPMDSSPRYLWTTGLASLATAAGLVFILWRVNIHGVQPKKKHSRR